jgi:hypothetical protein
MKKYVVKFNQIIRNEKKEVVATISSEVDMPMKEDTTNYAAFNAASPFVKAIMPNAEIEVLNVTSTKPRKEKEAAPATTATTTEKKA